MKVKYNIFENDWWWGHSTVFIATDGKSTIDLSTTDEYPGYGFLRCLMVHDSVKMQGRGTDIIDMAEKEAKARGLKYTYLDVNKTTWVKEWYERRGYTYSKESEESDKTITMIKEL